MTGLRERLAGQLISGATTVWLDCLEMRANARRSGADLSPYGHLGGVIVLHEWLSNKMIALAKVILPPR
jgi:hypothetical protein